MISQLSHVMTLANSIIGVSVLAMPFCFKQCGIVLATLVLLLSSVLSRLACHFLVKSAVMSRRRNFELLAFHALGQMGKFLVELFIIGFLVGTCIAFFVVMGDLGPQIVGKIIDKNPENIRTSLLITTSVFIVLPLGLLRNIDSLSSICTATIIFYLCLVLKIMAESMQHIFAGDWYQHVYYWRPAGILQCIPIFSMALFCQTQLFEIYDTIPNVSLEKMNEVVRGALNICTIVYLCVGFFGYIAFCTQPFTGNILMSFEPSLSSEMIKMGFVFSIAFSFPLVIFPCRASLNSLLFRRVYTHEPSINYLPEARFRCLTIAIVAMSLITGILIPNIEFVLGLVGSTIGVMICLIFPAIFFISISSKHTNERIIAQAILFIGMCIMILSTYANLYAMEESTNTKALATTSKPLSQINNLPLNLNKDDIHLMPNIPNNPEIIPDKIDALPDINIIDKSLNIKTKDMRQEPPIPVERIAVTEKPLIETQKSIENLVATFAPEIKEIVEKIKTLDEDLDKKSNDDPVKKDDLANAAESITSKAEEKIKIIEQKDMQKNDNLINSDAIKKEESELAADAEVDDILAAERHELLRKTLEKHKLEQLQMMQEQKEILKGIKEHKQEMLREKQLKDSEKKSKALEREFISKEIKEDLVNINMDGKKDLKNNIIDKVFNEKLEKLKLQNQFEQTNDNNNLEGKQVLSNQKESEKISKIDNNVDDEQKNHEIIQIANSPMRHVQNDDKLFRNEIITNQKLEVPESFPKISNSRELPKGPILNALTKRTLQKSVPLKELNDNEIIRNDKDPSYKVVAEKSSKIEDRKVEDQFSLPIALKMINQTKLNDPSALNKSEDNNKVLRRDILEDHEREKRDVDLEIRESKKSIDALNMKLEPIMKNVTVDEVHEECIKPRDKIEDELPIKSEKGLDQKLPIKEPTQVSLIKTNVYLSEQEIENSISVDQNIPVRGEYAKVKQRDLKAVDTDLKSDI